MIMRHTISILMENTFGAFDRVATMFSAKGFNLHSITIGETEIRDISRMTIVTSGDDQIIDQVVKQLNRLIDTIKVIDLTGQERTERELALISVNYQGSSLESLKNINDIFRGKVVAGFLHGMARASGARHAAGGKRDLGRGLRPAASAPEEAR